MKKIIATLAIAVLCNMSLNAQSVTGCYVPAYQQSQTQWCWAACGQMLYWSYLPGSITQCAFVNKSKEREQVFFGWFGCNNLNHSSTSACSSPVTFNQPQSIYGCDGSLADVLNQYGVPSTAYASSLSGATLSSNLSGKKLMVARWGWNGGGGHALVINRYKSGYVYFNNPGNGSANAWTYNTFSTANGQGSWTHTLRMNNSAVYGSAYYRQANENTTPVIPQDLSINVYPNPATEIVNILINGEQKTDSKILVTDAVGKVIFNEVYPKEKSSVTLQVANWGRGIYFVNVNNNSKLSKTLTLR